MTFAQLRAMYLSALGESPSGSEEAWTHLTEGYRMVTVDPNVDVPELATIDESVAVALGADYVEVSTVDFSIFAILNIFNKTDGYELRPEPGGMEGRARYLGTDGKPPAGKVTHYQRDGTKIYLRDTPDAATTLMVRARRQIAALSDADLNLSPLTPSHYDFAIIHFAVASYYSVHPKMSGEGFPIREDERYSAMAKAKIYGMKNPRAIEDKVRKETFRLRGYRMTPRSRW